jgi:leucyl-tRNA synthetase
MRTYDHTRIEKKWQARWEADTLYETPQSVKGKENAYLLVEFPYPSGNLHLGHWYAFAVPDIYARFLRMRGKNVLYPIGFDSFGLPAENAAIKHNLNPREWTYDNITHMTKQLKSMGASFDWSRRIVTSDPDYYRWTQWLFVQLHEQGLAYKKGGTVPWCDSCKTVLANEQVIQGTCERCGTTVSAKELAQWYLKITEYADRLLDDLTELPWPEEIKEAQREWIGKSAGARITFPVAGGSNEIEIFTTRPDTLFGATYMVLAPEHALVDELKDRITNWEEVERYVKRTKSKKELERKESKEKTGVELKGIRVINPATQEEIPVWIADYVLSTYGTGAVMAVPAHDTRDWEFAHTFRLPVREVVIGGNVQREAYEGTGNLMDSGSFSVLFSVEA